MRYSAYGDVGASASVSFSPTDVTASIGAGAGQKPGKCDGGNWWRCAELVTYFQEPTGKGYSRRSVIVSGSIYQVKVEVVNALLAMHMLAHKYGWANVKGQVRAMAWYLNYQRNWDFDDCIKALESAVAPAYDKYAADEDKKLAAAAAQAAKPVINFGLSPEWKACMQGELAKAKLGLPHDTVGCSKFLAGAAQPVPLLNLAPYQTSKPAPKSVINLFGMGPGMSPPPTDAETTPQTAAGEGGMSTTTMLLIAAGVIVVGGGIYLATRKKAA